MKLKTQFTWNSINIGINSVSYRKVNLIIIQYIINSAVPITGIIVPNTAVSVLPILLGNTYYYQYTDDEMKCRFLNLDF